MTSFIHKNRLLTTILILFAIDYVANTAKQNIISRQVVKIQHFTFSPNPIGKLLAFILMVCALIFFIFSQSNPSSMDAGILGGILFGFHGLSNYYLFKHYAPAIIIGETFYGASLFMLSTDIYTYLSS